MSNNQYMTKGVNARLDFYMDWRDWLEDGDSISTSTWTISPTGLDKGTDEENALLSDEGIRGVWLEGGTVDEIYKVVNRITTAQGRIEEKNFWVTIKN